MTFKTITVLFLITKTVMEIKNKTVMTFKTITVLFLITKILTFFWVSSEVNHFRLFLSHG